MHWLARRALRTQAAVRRLVVEGKALGPWTKTLRVVFLVTILFSVIATFVETVEPFTTGLAEIEARDPAAFDSVKPKEFPDPGSWGCARSFATLGDLFTRSGPIMVFVAFCELAYLAVFAAELALTLWASRLEVHDTRHTPRLKRAHIQAAAIQRACGCVQARWWCASLAVRFFGSCGAWMAERTCLPFTLDSIAGMALQAAASRRADVILRKVTRSRSRGGAAEPDPVTQTPLAPGSPTKRSARAKSVMRTRTAAPSSFMAPAGGTSGPSPLPNPMLAASSAANPLTARAGEAMLPVDPGGTPAGRVVRAPLAPSVTSSQAQLMLAAHAAANGGVVRASPADMSVRPASLPSWPRVRPVCCCLCADVPVPDPGTASCFLGQHVVHGRAHLWKPGSDVLTLTAARKRRERAIAEGRLGEDGGPADDAAPAFLGGGLDGEDGPGTPRFRRESGRSQGRAEAGTPRLNGSPTNWSDGDGAPSRRSSGSTTGFGSILTQLAAAGGSTRRVVSASALNRSRISEGVLRFGEVFGDDAVATMAFADGIVSPRAPQAAAAAVLAGFGGARPQADLRATGVAGVGAVPRRRTLPPRQGRDSQRDDLHSDAASRSRSRSDAPAVSPGGANAVSSSSSSSPSAKEQELAASRAAPMSPIPEGSVGGETEASSHAGTSRRSLRARGSDREMHTEGSDGKSDAKAVAGPRHVSPLASLGGAGQGDGLSGSGGGRPAAVDDDPAILAPVEQAWCTACLPRWLCAQACRAFARPSPQSAARAPFSPVADLIAAGSEAAVNWTLFSDRPSLRVAVPIVGGELAPLPIRSVVGADAAGLEPLSSSGSFVMRGLNLAAPASAAGAAVAYSSASSGSSTSAAGAAGGQRKSIGASAMLAVSAAEIELPRTRARSGSSPVTMGAGWRRPLPQAARPGRAGRRLDSLAIEIRNRAQQGRRSRVASGTDGSFGSGEGGDDDGSATGTANETEAAASASASAPGRTVMALGRSFTLHPSSAGAEAAGASVQGDPPSASMHTVDIAPEFLDVIPADWLWSRVWAFSRLERLLDAVFLVPGIVWLASGLDPTVVGPCVLGMNAWRVLRATRVVKVLRYFGRFSLLTEAFSRKIDALATSWLLCACGAVILAGLIFVAEFEASSEFNEMGSAFWWSIITLTTVGYGDKFPQQPAGKFIATVAALAGIALFTLPSSALAAGFSEYLQEREQATRTAVSKLEEVVRRRRMRLPFRLLRAKADRVLREMLRSQDGRYLRRMRRKAAVRKLFTQCAGEQGEVFLALAASKKIEKRLRVLAHGRLRQLQSGGHTAEQWGAGGGGPPVQRSAAASMRDDEVLVNVGRFLSNPGSLLGGVPGLSRADSGSSNEGRGSTASWGVTSPPFHGTARLAMMSSPSIVGGPASAASPSPPRRPPAPPSRRSGGPGSSPLIQEQSPGAAVTPRELGASAWEEIPMVEEGSADSGWTTDEDIDGGADDDSPSGSPTD